MPSLQDRLQRRLRASKVTEDESDYSDDYSDDYSEADGGQRKQTEGTPNGEPTSDYENGGSEDSDSEEEGTEHRRRKYRHDSDGEDLEEADDDLEDHNNGREEEEDISDEGSESNAAEALANISFGALAQAQAAMGPSLKRKRGINSSSVADPSTEAAAEDPASRPHRKTSRSPSPFHEASERRQGKKLRDKVSRASKHAPTEITSKRAVSRRRTVVNIPSKPQARDPRFAALPGSSTTTATSYPSLHSRHQQNNNTAHHTNPSLSSSTAAPNSAYAFLADYRASELAELKAQAKQERDPAKREALTKQLRAIEDRDRARRKVEEERAVLREHRKKERDMVGKGKQPFFLKKGEVKRQAMIKRYEGLGEKRMEKMLEKRRKKKAAKERKGMPAARRGFAEG